MRSIPVVLTALLAGAVLAGGAVAQETEAPSSRPLPSAGAPPPPLSAPAEGPASSQRPDRDAAKAAVRAQCGADRARFCRGGGGDAGACLAAHFPKLGVDCQTAVNASREAHTEREVVAPH